MYGGFDHANPPKIGFSSSGRACVTNEDVDISDRDDEDAARVFSNRNPEVILWDDGEARIVEDAPDGDGIADACKSESRLDPCC
jgi:hypothetical protein